jgi:hypothetical protein
VRTSNRLVAVVAAVLVAILGVACNPGGGGGGGGGGGASTPQAPAASDPSYIDY